MDGDILLRMKNQTKKNRHVVCAMVTETTTSNPAPLLCVYVCKNSFSMCALIYCPPPILNNVTLNESTIYNQFSIPIQYCNMKSKCYKLNIVCMKSK